MPSPTNADSSNSCVAVDFRTLPGGPLLAFDQGKTLTHELGHFFGLAHTFGDGGCGYDDGIADTPAMAKPTGGCPSAPVDSCPGSPGTDPSWSFMDYSDDACMQRFSPGQVARMQAVVLAAKPAMLDLVQPARMPPPPSPSRSPPSRPKPRTSAIKKRPPPKKASKSSTRASVANKNRRGMF
jgi:hypothetical protein